ARAEGPAARRDPDAAQAGLRRTDRSVVSWTAAAPARGHPRAVAVTRRGPAGPRWRGQARRRARHGAAESRQGAMEPGHARAVAPGVPARRALVLTFRPSTSARANGRASI